MGSLLLEDVALPTGLGFGLFLVIRRLIKESLANMVACVRRVVGGSDGSLHDADLEIVWATL